MRGVIIIGLLYLGVLSAHGGAIGEKAVENHIRPAYHRLAETVEQLKYRTEAFCAAADAGNRAALDKAFAKAVQAWAGIEHIRFGPIAENNRYERFAFWPDPRNIAQKQLSRALREKDAGLIRADSLSEKSVALQGLTAFEDLLWAEDIEERLADADNKAFVCGYAAALAENLFRIAMAVQQAWASDTGYAGQMSAPAEQKTFRDQQEVTLQLYKAFQTGLQQLRENKLARVLGGNPGQAKPRRAAFWRSGNAIAVLQANAEALENLFLEAGLEELVRQSGSGVETAVLDEFELIKSNLASIATLSIAEALGSEKAWAKLNLIRLALANIENTGGSAIAEAAKLPLSFNALDGD